VLHKEGHRTRLAESSGKIQATSASHPSTPSWFGDVVIISSSLRTHGVLGTISEQGRVARKRCGRAERIDVLTVLFGSALSGERTLEALYERLQPCAVPFMAVCERDPVPSRSALSRFVAAVTEEAVEALRTRFLKDLLARPLTPAKPTGGLVDRQGDTWRVCDIDGTREAARQRAFPQTDERPLPFRQVENVCAPGSRGRTRGETVRTRTTVSPAHRSQWLGSCGNRGNGRSREELRTGLCASGRDLAAHQLPPERTLIRRDGHDGNGAVLSDVAGFACVTCGKDNRLLDHPRIQTRVHLPPDQVHHRPESQLVRSLSACPQILVGSEGMPCRVVVATHPAGKNKSPMGVTRAGVVSERFFTNLPHQAFPTRDVVAWSLHRGACEPILSDEDRAQDPDRWGSHSAWGQEYWHVISLWVWNRRLEGGHQLTPEPLRTTECAPVLPSPPPYAAPASGSAPPKGG